MALPTSISQAVEAMALRACAYLNFYPVFSGTVQTQNADGTLEWKADGPFLTGLSRLTVRTPAPGMTITVQPGKSRCGVIFENGDRTKPTAVLFDPTVGATLTMAINATQWINLFSPAVGLGGTATSPATHPLIEGDVQKLADDNFDTAIENARAALAIASAAITTTMASISTSGAPTPGTLIGPPVEAINVALLALGTALSAAAVQHTAARTGVLSNVSKTA